MVLKRLFSKKPDEGIEHSIQLKALSKVPLSHRDLEWDRSFMAHLGKAKLACRTPQIAKGEDGFTYFELEIPDVGAPFQAYTVENLISDHLLRDGHGVKVFSYSREEDRRFSYGELLNYYYRQEFRSHIQNWLKPTPDQFSGELNIMGGDPAESVLHPFTRKLILAYLVKNGFHFPKISHINVMTKDGIMNQLVLNLEPSMFLNQKHFQDVLSSLKWYFPVHYTYTSVPEHYLSNIFYDL
ncbi:hypothetical protein [Portibacter marinus]|uniref:hypothetical protein n=1 Tax=Portibacter marinus TaxID=2898660 RepID=UPI001F1FB72D|nr:hypothetical protein [Portibacter marinus]